MIPDRFKPVVNNLKAALDASLDPVCIVNSQNQIAYMNLPMKNFLGMRLGDLKKGKNFCECVLIAACKPNCQILDVLRTGTPLRLDETPATRGKDRLRLSLKVVPIYEGGAPRGIRPIGAIVALRDSTGEILLQAKYHKLLGMIEDKDNEIRDVQDRLRELQKSLRDARDSVL